MRALADEMFGRRAFLLGAAASFAALFLPRSARAADIGTAKPDGVTLLRAARLSTARRCGHPASSSSAAT